MPYNLKFFSALFPRNTAVILNGKFATDFNDLYFDIPLVNTKWFHWWLMNISSDIGLVSPGNNPLPEQMLTHTTYTPNLCISLGFIV